LTISLLLFSCLNSEKKIFNYKETKTGFFDLAHGDWKSNEWIRRPENLKMLNETFKKFGYLDILRNFDLESNEFMIRDVYIKNNFWQLFDSLEITYKQKTIESKYYREFWQRRRIEKNDRIVFEIIKDINLSRNTKMVYCVNYENDTLYDLLKIEFDNHNLTKEKAIENFETLKKYGFHQSAYNMLFERNEYYNINWNRDSLVKTLDTTSVYNEAWIEDNTK
jgi:hypothetical protein